MPRGKYVNHKGRGRSFTSPEELAREQKDLELKKLKKRQQQEAGIESEEEEESDEGAKQEEAAAKGSSDEEESGSGSEDEDGNQKAKGVEGLIEIENPNRRVMKAKKPSTKLEGDAGAGAGASSSSTAAAAGGAEKPELSRREREAIEKQRAKAHYQKLHAEGKTEEARKDLARLAIIRKQREEAALKRQQEQQEKETVKQNKQSEIGKALGKK